MALPSLQLQLQPPTREVANVGDGGSKGKHVIFLTTGMKTGLCGNVPSPPDPGIQYPSTYCVDFTVVLIGPEKLIRTEFLSAPSHVM